MKHLKVLSALTVLLVVMELAGFKAQSYLHDKSCAELEQAITCTTDLDCAEQVEKINQVYNCSLEIY